MLFHVLFCAVMQTGAASLLRGMQAHGRSIPLAVTVNYAVAALGGIAFTLWYGQWPDLLRVLTIGVPAGVFYSTGLFVLLRCMGQRGLAVTMAVANTSQLVPCVLAALLGQPPSWMQTIGIVVAAAAIPALTLARASGRAIHEPPRLAVAAGLFVLNGGAQSCNMLANIYLDPVSQPVYVSVLFAVSFVVALPFLLRSRETRPTPADWRRGSAFGAMNVATTGVILYGLLHVPGAIFYAASSVIGLLLITVVAVTLWQERLQRWGWAGLAAAVVAVALMSSG
jgi:drug/metabolite transporter (DMT)-like permease